MTSAAAKRIEFGDFQTPSALAQAVCHLVAQTGLFPRSIVEPTCGVGSFLSAALDTFPSAEAVRGIDCNPRYVHCAREVVAGHPGALVEEGDFFRIDWETVMSSLPDPILVIGNPPWVTNAVVGALGGTNLPQKRNADGLRGIEALTGESNFDVSEWILREIAKLLDGRTAALAMLCKTVVARKVLAWSWSNRLSIKSSRLYRIDAEKEFGASVDACLLVIDFAPASRSDECSVHDDLTTPKPSSCFGIRGRLLVSDTKAFDRLSHLYHDGLTGWRSGIKHDCARVFEVKPRHGVLINGYGQEVQIEPEVLYPLLKSSDIARHRQPRRLVLIPQQSMDESPSELKSRAPSAWQYLLSHSEALDRRKSSIYKGRPRFSIFGIGPYSFALWKVAISGLYKEFAFSKVGPDNGRPVLVDDTCYLFACESEHQSDLLHRLVTSHTALEFWSSLVFWDCKRPITAKLLNTLNLSALAEELGFRTTEARQLGQKQQQNLSENRRAQTELFSEFSTGGLTN